MTSTRRKILVPLSTLLAASAIAVGSGATFTSTTSQAVSGYATGTLAMVNDKANEAVFAGQNLEPGKSLTGSVTITNSGTLSADMQLVEKETLNTFADPELLTVTVTEIGASDARTVVAHKELGAVGAVDLGTFAAGEKRTYDFVVTLAEAADNDNQGKTATVGYTWNGVQTGDDESKPGLPAS